MTRLVLMLMLAIAAAPQALRAQSLQGIAHGVPVGQASAEPLRLSLSDAVTRGLEQNLAVILEEQRLKGVRSARLEALSELWPQVSGSLRQSQQVLSTAAFGFTLPGFPAVIGPFGVFDARVSLSTPIFDPAAFGGIKSSRASVRAGEASVRDVREAVVLGVGSLYLQAEADAARVDSARAQVATAEVLVRLAEDQRAAGLVAGIDVVRQQVQLQSSRARQIAAENALDKSKLLLARAIGLPAGQAYTLSDPIAFQPAAATTFDAAVLVAETHRADLQAAQARVEAARSERSAEAAGHLPSVHLDADVGALGPRGSATDRTYTVAAVVRVPVFDGGRTRARVQQAEAQVSQREAELADVQAGLRYEIEGALLDIKAASAGVDVADRARALSLQELEQAQDRFRAGVSSTLELVQAQEAVASATDQYIASVHAHAIAQASLVRATGQVVDQFVAVVRGPQP